MIAANEREILRSLAGRVREIAELPHQEERRRWWLRHNALDPERPLVLCFPEGAWTELLPDSELVCESGKLRQWERDLRRKVYWWEHIRDDNLLEPWFDLNWDVARDNYGVEIPTIHGKDRGSYRWDPPLKDLERDMGRLRFRKPSVDRQATAENLELAGELFGDLLPPRLRGRFWWTLGLTWEAAKLVGLENLMLLMCDQPQAVHRLMAWLRDEHMNYIEWFAKEGLLSLTNEADYVGSGGVGCTQELPRPERRPAGPVQLRDLWGFAESQETVGVSPAMYEEFVFPYQLPLLERFGLNCYGCCEPLDKRIDRILEIPRLRRVSVAPWADQELMAEKLGRRIICSRKPNPTLICVDFDEQRIREDIRFTLQVAGQGVLEIIMKDTHTIQNKAWRITRWVEIAREEVEGHLSTR